MEVNPYPNILINALCHLFFLSHSSWHTFCCIDTLIRHHCQIFYWVIQDVIDLLFIFWAYWYVVFASADGSRLCICRAWPMLCYLFTYLLGISVSYHRSTFYISFYTFQYMCSVGSSSHREIFLLGFTLWFNCCHLNRSATLLWGKL